MEGLETSAHSAKPRYALKGLALAGITVAVLLILTWIFTRWDLDRAISARFYSADAGWRLAKTEPWYWFYRYGTIPGVALTIVSLVGVVATYRRIPETQWHRYFLLILLTSVIGAGLLVNGVLKPYWGRPRPNQVREFGGQYSYRSVLDPGIPGKGKSFPSGHSSMGFIFVSLVYLRRKSAFTAWSGGLGGLCYGSLMSAARVVQGAHFVTDCIWSLGIVWLTATLLYYNVLRIPAAEYQTFEHQDEPRKRGLAIGGTSLTIVIVLLFLIRQPFYETYYVYTADPRSEIAEMRVGLEGGYDRANVRYSEHDPFRVLIHVSGLEWPGASLTPEVVFSETSGKVYQGLFQVKQQGYFSGVEREIEVVVPRGLEGRLRVVFLEGAGPAQTP